MQLSIWVPVIQILFQRDCFHKLILLKDYSCERICRFIYLVIKTVIRSKFMWFLRANITTNKIQLMGNQLFTF